MAASRISIETARPRLLAAVRHTVTLAQIGRTWQPALDQVWQFLRSQPGLHAGGGHNVFLYHHPGRMDAPMEIDFGVEVTRTFAPSGGVAATATPAGAVAACIHIGPYERLGETHQAIHAWATAGNRQFAGQSWEIYGDWTDDASKLETTVMYLLK